MLNRLTPDAAPVAGIIRGFKGINNRLDPVALGLEWQVQADNALCDDAGFLINRPGQRAILTDIADIHDAADGRLLAVTATGALIEVTPDGHPVLLAEGIAGAPFVWAELGYAVFVMSERGQWALYPDRVVPWGIPSCPPPTTAGTGDHTYQIACVFQAPDGRIGGTHHVVAAPGAESGGVTVWPPMLPGYRTRIYASTPDGAELLHAATAIDSAPVTLDGRQRGSLLDTLHHDPPPVGEVIASHHNRMVIGAWEPEQDRSILYYSRADNPHLFRLDRDFQIVAGRITLLASIPRGLVIGTDRAIYVDSLDAPVQQVAGYGVPLGARAHDDHGVIYFWSQRGLCRAAPFQNLTDAHYVARSRERQTAALLPWQGSTYVIVSQQGAPLERSRAAFHRPLPILEVFRHDLANQQ
ncbi:MAG TPA: hypothetical protein PLP22_01965 [Candidatus Competibacter sp.]|nr:hypothetical protein [Candidatus Competibacteraceae bacterium]HRE53542.1 hypothetical protein [Candidatus Competibacter sp.]HUM93275.1 hypothetical protein [Candidatus Competibacter sp.]